MIYFRGVFIVLVYLFSRGTAVSTKTIFAHCRFSQYTFESVPVKLSSYY
jgi:hypothetical protein